MMSQTMFWFITINTGPVEINMILGIVWDHNMICFIIIIRLFSTFKCASSIFGLPVRINSQQASAALNSPGQPPIQTGEEQSE